MRLLSSALRLVWAVRREAFEAFGVRVQEPYMENLRTKQVRSAWLEDVLGTKASYALPR